MRKIIVLLTVLFASTAAQAEGQASVSQKIYAELGYQNVNIKDGSFSASPSAISGVVGYQFHPNVAAELFLATGVSDSTDRSAGTDIRTKVDNSYGFFIKPSLRFTDKFEGFARVGYLHSKTSYSSGRNTNTVSDNSWAYGVGANYYFTEKVYGQVSYTSLFDKDSVTARGFGVAVGMKF